MSNKQFWKEQKWLWGRNLMWFILCLVFIGLVALGVPVMGILFWTLVAGMVITGLWMVFLILRRIFTSINFF